MRSGTELSQFMKTFLPTLVYFSIEHEIIL